MIKWISRMNLSQNSTSHTAVLLERLESVKSILCVHIPGKKSPFFAEKC